MDKVHLFSTDNDYRPVYQQLPLLTFLPVPFILMTATATDHVDLALSIQVAIEVSFCVKAYV